MAIIEVDDAGRQISSDQIPWSWTLNFKGTEFTVTDNLNFESGDFRGNEREVETTHRSCVRVKLRPGSMRESDGGDDEPSYTFFGTDRPIADFQLEILVVAGDLPEGCTSWGSVSYTAEVDFHNDTTADTVQFYLMVSQGVFDRYLWNIAQGLADDIYLSVGHVAGFYSEWSPSISTNHIKVLAGSEHVVDDAGELGAAPLGQGRQGRVLYECEARARARQCPKERRRGRGASRWIQLAGAMQMIWRVLKILSMMAAMTVAIPCRHPGGS